MADPENSFNADNDIDDDVDDDEIVEENLRDGLTKQSFSSLINNATTGTDLLKIFDLLPNSSQRYGHSLSMNALIKIITRHPVFRERASIFNTVKIKKGKETTVPSTFISLSPTNKQLLKGFVAEVNPTNGPWWELTQLLRNCEEAFNDSAASLRQVGMPANRIACISHMLCDERVVACLIPLSVPVQSQERPAVLDQQKETGKSLSDSVYGDIFSHYKEWIKEYVNPFVDGPFAEDVGMFKPHLATFKDANTIKGYIKMVVSKVETILKNHKQSGHHSSGEERLQEIKNNFLNPKGKNVDYSYFYAFLMLEEKDLKFASRHLEEGIGASAGFGTVGGGVTAVKKKRNVQEVVALDIQSLTKKIAESADGIREDTQRAITRLFSPSPTFSDVSYAARSGGVTESTVISDSYTSAKEEKIIVERKLLCINQQMDYHKYVLMSEFFDAEEKKKSKAELDKIMAELNDLKK